MPRPLPLALALLLPSAALAQEVALVLPPGAEDGLAAGLEAASLTFSLEAQGLTGAQDYVAAARADYRRLLTALYAEGYYGGVISIAIDGQEAAAIQPLEAPQRIGQVVIRVDPGPRFTFGRAALGPLAPATELPPGFGPGEVARSGAVQAAVEAAILAWREEGNAKAAVASEALVAVQPENVLNAEVVIDPGPELTFGEVAVSGNEDVRTARILRIAGIPTGQVFDPDELDRAAQRLRRTGTFTSVAIIEAEEIGPGDTLPIGLQVVEALPRRLGFGAEISSLDGLSLTAFWLHRNLLGGAERLRIEGSVSEIEGEALDTAAGGVDYALGLSFSRPSTFSADNDFFVNARISREDEEDFLLDQFTFETGILRYVGDNFTASAAVGLLVAQEETRFESRDYVLATLPLSATLDRRDDPRDARSGFYIDLDATPFASVAGEGGNGARLYADGRYFRTFGTRVTLAARGQAGSVLGAERDEVPQDFLFFSGGGGTVRGQPFRSLGVEVADPDAPGETATLGGGSFLGAQIEARVGLTESWGAVAFADIGTVDEGAFPDGDSPYQAGVGLGARYLTAIGPIRVDVATPATGDDAFGEVQLYIGIGQSF